MAHAQTAVAESTSMWEGGQEPFKASYGKLMMWFFLLSDAFTFSGLLVTYGALRFSYDKWADPNDVFNHLPFVHGHFPLVFVGIMTFILIMSSVTMVLAVDAGHRMQKREVAWYMLYTIIGGALFLGCQAFEWYSFITGTEDGALVNGVQVFGANLSVNQYGPPLFADLFFFITGFHGTHVASGVVLNFIILLNVLDGTYERRGHYEMVEKVGLYWHFVDLVWVFVFTFFYLL